MACTEDKKPSETESSIRPPSPPLGISQKTNLVIVTAVCPQWTNAFIGAVFGSFSSMVLFLVSDSKQINIFAAISLKAYSFQIIK